MAIGFFGLAAVGLSRAITLSAKAASRTQIELSMINKLQSALTEAHKTPQLEEGSFVTDPDLMGVSIETEFLPLEEMENEDGQLLQNMWLVRCSAYWEKDGVEKQMTAETFRFAPMYLAQ
ncbi:MAG: hypothetical protein P8J87_17930 [Verrucomicrobiales bacterium]|nr:hypothetical protein [Verrucomicrobiales bacterium]